MEVKKKQFTYRGKTIEELKEMEVREFAKFLHSTARRYLLRNFQEVEKFVNRSKIKISRKKTIRTHQRDLVIVPQLVGMKLHIYNGKSFIPVEVIGEMLGHKFGEFAPSRGRVNHGKAGIGATKGSKHKSKK